jgi:hypothetical protein
MAAPPEDHLVEILETLCQHEVKFVIAGGVAMILHGVARSTSDLDITLLLTDENLQAFLNVARSLRLESGIPIPPERLLEPESMVQAYQEKGCLVYPFRDPNFPQRHVDVFITPDKSYDALRLDAVPKPFGRHTLWIASLEKMWKMKKQIQPPREKDIPDIFFLRKRGFTL